VIYGLPDALLLTEQPVHELLVETSLTIGSPVNPGRFNGVDSRERLQVYFLAIGQLLNEVDPNQASYRKTGH
jgi:hypothetical protein